MYLIGFCFSTTQLYRLAKEIRMDYQHILLVTDLKEDANLVAQKTKEIQSTCANASLSVLNIVVDNMTGFGYEFIAYSPSYEASDLKRVQEASKRLTTYIEDNQLVVDETEIKVALSNIDGITQYIKDNDVDLVVIGHHSHKGLMAWFNKGTADNLLPNLRCDMLVVNI